MHTAAQRRPLELDLGDRQREARLHAESNPKESLAAFLRVFPARSWEALPPEDYDEPLEHFLISPIVLEPHVGVELTPAAAPISQPSCELPINDIYAEESSRNGAAEFPERLSDNEAVHRAYRLELQAIATFLKHDLSVLITCDKILTEHVFEWVCKRAGKRPVLDDALTEGARSTPGADLDRALQGNGGSVEARLPLLIRNLKPDEVLVLRSIDILNTPPLIEILYQGTHGDKKPQLLGFLDPSLEAKKVLTDRFAVHFPIMGLPRHVQPDPAKPPVHTVGQLLTAQERACFKVLDPEGLYKNVAGLNAIQFRNGMRYVGATVAPGTDPRDIYDVIRQFKTSSSNEIEIPNTSFKDIGGYDHVKQELQRIIALVTGRVGGIDDRQRQKLVPRGFLFHGPPGTGKTLFAKAIANEMNATIQMVSGPEIMDKYVGQSESNLRHIFATARRNAPSVIFFDEFDSIASQRSTYSDGGARANNAVVAQLLTELDGFREDQAVLVIGTSNRLDIIDEALLRPSRLRPIEISLPDYTARRSVAAIHAHNFGIDHLLTDLCGQLLEVLPAWSPAAPVPDALLTKLFLQHPPHKHRWELEIERAGFARELRAFFHVIRESEGAGRNVGSTENPFQLRMEERLLQLARKYGMNLTAGDRPGMAEKEASAGSPSIQQDIVDLLALLQEQRRQQSDLSPAMFLSGVLDLIAEYTQDFNNDEIRAIFQEASLEYHMEGQLISPRYLGLKIGLLKKRRDERGIVHLRTDRGRR